MELCICISGKGGQGIRKLGECLAEAAILKGFNVVQANTYTPEVRGGSSSTDIIISDKDIYYPLIEKLDILLALYENAYIQNIKRIYKNTVVIYDPDFIYLPESPNIISIPLTQIAKEEFKDPIFSNMIGLGVLIQVIDMIGPEIVISVLEKRIKQLSENSIKAFLKGLKIGKRANEKNFQHQNRFCFV